MMIHRYENEGDEIKFFQGEEDGLYIIKSVTSDNDNDVAQVYNQCFFDK